MRRGDFHGDLGAGALVRSPHTGALTTMLFASQGPRRRPDDPAALRAVSIALEKVTKTYETQAGDDIWAVAPIDVCIDAGQFVSIVGPSGCGKSTLLMMIAGLIPPTTGSVRLNGEIVNRPHPEIAVVFQQDLLLYWRRILDNVLLPIEIKRWGRSRFARRAEQLLDQVGLAGFSNKYPDELSG